MVLQGSSTTTAAGLHRPDGGVGVSYVGGCGVRLSFRQLAQQKPCPLSACCLQDSCAQWQQFQLRP